MAKPIPGHPCRKVLFNLQVVSGQVEEVFGHDNPRLETANRVLSEAVKRLRDAVEWQEQYDPEITALTQPQIDNANERLRFQLDPEFREEVLEDAEQMAHEKRKFNLERLKQSDTNTEDNN